MAYIGNVPAEKYIALTQQTFSSPTGTSFTLSQAVTNSVDIDLYIDNVKQDPTTYSVSGTTLTTSTIASPSTMYCIYNGKAMQTVNPPDGSVGTAKVADDAITLAKLAPGTDGNIISFDASGNPVAIATGSSGQVLTSGGAGAAPSFAAAAGGKVVQVVYTLSTAETSGTTVVVYDDTPQTITEGNEFLTRTITPTDSSNILYVEGTINLGQSNTGGIVIITSLFRDAVTNALGTWGLLVDANTVMSAVPYHYVMVAGTTSEITFRMRSGSNSAGTHYMNRGGSASLWGGLSTSTMIVTEISA